VCDWGSKNRHVHHVSTREGPLLIIKWHPPRLAASRCRERRAVRGTVASMRTVERHGWNVSVAQCEWLILGVFSHFATAAHRTLSGHVPRCPFSRKLFTMFHRHRCRLVFRGFGGWVVGGLGGSELPRRSSLHAREAGKRCHTWQQRTERGSGRTCI